MYSKGFALFSSGGVNQGHEEVSDVGAVFGFEEVGVLSVQYRLWVQLF